MLIRGYRKVDRRPRDRVHQRHLIKGLPHIKRRAVKQTTAIGAEIAARRHLRVGQTSLLFIHQSKWLLAGSDPRRDGRALAW